MVNTISDHSFRFTTTASPCLCSPPKPVLPGTRLEQKTMKLSLTILLAAALSLSSASPVPAPDPDPVLEQHETGLEERQIVSPNWAAIRDQAFWANDLAAQIVNQPLTNADNLLAAGNTQAAANARQVLANLRFQTFVLAQNILAFAQQAQNNIP